MRQYETTHPWITFGLRFDPPPQLFVLAGEIQSKVDHVARVPLRADVASEIYALYLAKGALATTAIEGNTLDLEDALAAVEGAAEVSKSREYQLQEIENIIAACNDIDAFLAEKGPQPLTVDLIKRWNFAVLDGTEHEPSAVPGEFREHSVVVGNAYRAAPAEDVSYLMDRLLDWLNSGEFSQLEGVLGRAGASLVKAVVAHVYIAWIHPFGDGNGRTARLVEYAMLHGEGGVSAASAQLLSNHYNATRDRYYRRLAEASASGGELMPVLLYAAQGFADGLREQIEYITSGYLRELVWRDYVDTQLELYARNSEVTIQAKRRIRWKTLAIALYKERPRSQRRGFFNRRDVTRLTPDVAAAYAGTQSRTLTRDLNIMVEAGLVQVSGPWVAADVRQILRLMPPTVERPPDNGQVGGIV